MKNNRFIHLILFLGLNTMGFCQVDNPYQRFDELWDQYTKQTDVPTLVEDVNKAMKSKELEEDGLLHANYELLLGLIEGDINRLRNVIESYRALNNLEGVEAASLSLTKLLVNAGNNVEARKLITEIKDTNELSDFTEQAKARTAGMLAFYASVVSIQEKNYEQALEEVTQSLKFFQSAKDGARVVQVNTRIGLLEMLTGDMEKGYEITLSAQSALTKNGDQDQYYYSLLNVLLYQKCFKQREAVVVQGMVQKRMKTIPRDPEFEQLYDLVVSWCRK